MADYAKDDDDEDDQRMCVCRMLCCSIRVLGQCVVHDPPIRNIVSHNWHFSSGLQHTNEMIHALTEYIDNGIELPNLPTGVPSDVKEIGLFYTFQDRWPNI